MMVEDKYVVEIKGKRFVTYAGLLSLAHEKGVKKLMVVDLRVDWDKKCASCTVKCELEDKVFWGVGSGTQENCGAMVREHFVEMSHTRAKARALRDALNVDLVAVDELSKNDEVVEETLVVDVPLVCADCNKTISKAEKDYSIKFFGRTLCRACQAKQAGS